MLATSNIGRFLSTLTLGIVTAAGWASAQSQDPKYSLDDWMSVTRVGSFEISPDGQFFYYTSNAGDSGTREIFRVPVSGGSPVQISSNPQDIRPEPKQGLVMSADGKTIYCTSARYFQNYMNIFRVSTDGGTARQITFNDAVIETAAAPSPDGKTLAYFVRASGGTQINLLDLENPNQWPRPFAPAGDNERAPVWSPDGANLAFSRGGDIWIRPLDNAEPRRLIAEPYSGGNGSPVWSPDGSRIAFTTGKSGYAQVGVAEVATGRVTPITFEPREHSSVSWSPDGRLLTFIRNDEMGMSREVVVAAADGSGEARVLTRSQGVRSSPRFLPDGGRIAFIETTDTRTADIWSISVEGDDPRQHTNSMGRIDPSDLSIPEEVTYMGPGNLAIPALLYKPWNFDPNRKYPVIVRLHGHPGQWVHSMSSEWQYFMERGFVLIAPNPRGSRGFGQGFHDLHIGDYGGAEYEDAMNALDFLDTLGYVDMTRKATWGGSGGGYLSLVIATKAPTAFEAQVIRAPVSSWKHLAIDRYAASGRTWTPTRTPRRERSEFGGPYDEIPEQYDERSPINFVERVQVPQLLFQGLRDSSVPPNQSQMWAERMRELGKGDLLDYVELPDEDHGLTRYRATVRDRLERMERFFAEHLRLN